MSYIKKSFSMLFCLSLLAQFNVNADVPYQKSPHGTAICLVAAGIFTAIPLGVHWYNNCYKVDRLSIKSLLKSLNQKLDKIENIIITFSTQQLKDTIIKAYPHFAYPYLTSHQDITNALNTLWYYKKALQRKMKQKKFSDITIINELSNRISQLTSIQSQIERISEYQQEKSTRDSGTNFSMDYDEYFNPGCRDSYQPGGWNKKK